MRTIWTRRRQTAIVSLECLEPCDEHSFCKSMGTLTADEGYDLHLTDLGQAYAVDVATDGGGGAARPATRQRARGDRGRHPSPERGAQREVAALHLPPELRCGRAAGAPERRLRPPAVGGAGGALPGVRHVH